MFIFYDLKINLISPNVRALAKFGHGKILARSAIPWPNLGEPQRTANALLGAVEKASFSEFGFWPLFRSKPVLFLFHSFLGENQAPTLHSHVFL